MPFFVKIDADNASSESGEDSDVLLEFHDQGHTLMAAASGVSQHNLRPDAEESPAAAAAAAVADTALSSNQPLPASGR